MDKVQHEINKTYFFKDTYPISLKIVRGAYLAEEKQIQKKNNRSVVWNNKDQTDSSYNFNAEKIVKNLNSKSEFILATHNNESNIFLMHLIENSPHEAFLRERVHFATLLGLNDYFTFETLNRNFKTIKVRRA